MEVYNLIIELEVDLDHELTLGELTEALNEKQKDWSKCKDANPSSASGVRATTNLNAIQEYNKILQDISQVKELYADAREKRTSMRAEAEADLDKAIEYYHKGPPSESNIQAIIKRFKEKGFTEKEISNRINKQKPIEPTGSSSPNNDPHISIFVRLHKKLDDFGKDSVVDFLGLPNEKRYQREELELKSKEAQSKYRSLTNSANGILGKDIAAICNDIFRDEAKYNKYLSWLKELPAKKMIESKIYGFKEISVRQYIEILSESQKDLNECALAVRLLLDKYLTDNKISTDFVGFDPEASITCYCSKRSRLIDYTCPDGHESFYKCSNCNKYLPRNILICECGGDLNPIIRRIKSAQEARDWESLGRMVEEEGISKMDYFSSSDYKNIFQSVEDGLQKRKAEAAKIEQLYKQFCDCVSRGNINGAFQLWREEFRNRSDAQAMLSKLSSFRPDKIKITAIRDRGEKKILELKVPPGITHIGVKASGQSEPSVYTIAEIRNMLEINGQCSGVTLYGILSIAGKELQGDATIQTFTGTRSRQVIPFSLEWPGSISFISGKTLKIQIKNSNNGVLRIPETLLIGDYSLAVPFKKTHGSVLATYGPDVIEPNDVLTWEYSLKNTQGNLSVNLFAKDDPDVSYEPISGMVLSRRL